MSPESSTLSQSAPSWSALREATVTLRDDALSERFATVLERCRTGPIPFNWDVFILLAQHMSPGSIGDDLALVYAGQMLPSDDSRWFEIATRACAGSELACYAYAMLPPDKREKAVATRAAD